MKNQTNLNFRIDWKENGSATINLSKPIVAIYQKKKKKKNERIDRMQQRIFFKNSLVGRSYFLEAWRYAHINAYIMHKITRQ